MNLNQEEIEYADEQEDLIKQYLSYDLPYWDRHTCKPIFEKMININNTLQKLVTDKYESKFIKTLVFGFDYIIEIYNLRCIRNYNYYLNWLIETMKYPEYVSHEYFRLCCKYKVKELSAQQIVYTKLEMLGLINDLDFAISHDPINYDMLSALMSFNINNINNGY